MISARITTCEFVGSFYKLDQLPTTRFPEIAFSGRSNVGKSSLLNRLVGRKKIAKVSTTPGKTRSLNYYTINDRYYFVDLPGYGYAKVSRVTRNSWGQMIETYLSNSPHLIGLVQLLDCRREPNEEDHQLIAWLAAHDIPTLLVVTKVDKLSRDKGKRAVARIEKEFGAPALGFSSVTGVGKAELLSSISYLVNEHTKDKKA